MQSSSLVIFRMICNITMVGLEDHLIHLDHINILGELEGV